MEEKPVLFLDVDGVLNSMDWFTTAPLKRATDLNPAAVKRIKRVLVVTGARIVLSSSWRHHDAWIQELRDAGLEITDKTPRIDGAPRADEIRAWLNDHPEVKTIAIVDDDPDAGLGWLSTRFVRTYFKHGLYGKHERRLIELLSGDLPYTQEAK